VFVQWALLAAYVEYGSLQLHLLSEHCRGQQAPQVQPVTLTLTESKAWGQRGVGGWRGRGQEGQGKAMQVGEPIQNDAVWRVKSDGEQSADALVSAGNMSYSCMVAGLISMCT